MKQEVVVQSLVLSAKVIVLRDDGKALLLRRSETDPRRPLTWDLPGGAIEKNEDPKAGCIREAQEEAGIHVEIDDILDALYLEKGAEGYPLVMHFYRGTTTDSVIKLSYEHDEFEWIDPKDIRNYEMPEKYYELFEKLAT